ncbi:MAG: acyl-CoA dehydrogenase family protein [Myxococcota bacterium]|nr:acyl-CoA dehydrogenase family protein [Myxococcota bacterium]
MDLRYGEEHEHFRAQVREFIAQHRARAPRGQGVMGARASEAMLAWQRLLVERGYAARTVPREYGGYGGQPDILETIIVGEEFARAGVTTGVSGPGIDMLVPTLLEHGSEEQKQRFVPPTIRGELVWCQGYSEPGSGSDLASLMTAGVEDGDDLIVNGQKIWTSSAHLADMMFALVRTEPEARRHAGISYLLIPMDTLGIEVRPLRAMTGDAEFNQVFFSDVRVPQTNVVGRRGQGWEIAHTTLAHERQVAGNPRDLESMLESLVGLMQSETCNGARAMDHASFRDRLLRLQARVLGLKCHAMRLLAYDLRDEPPGVAALVVKLQACELMREMAALGLDVMGELGALYDGSKYERAEGSWQAEYMRWVGFIIAGGTAQIQKNIIAERGLGLPREPRPGAAR